MKRFRIINDTRRCAALCLAAMTCVLALLGPVPDTTAADSTWHYEITPYVWGAGLDVTNPEPMNPTNPLLNMPRVCITPHIGSSTIQARNGMALQAAENILAYYSNNKIPYPIGT